MKPPVLVAMPISPALRERLAEDFTVHGPLDRTSPLPLPGAAADAQALVTLGGMATDAALLAALPRLGLIVCYGTGFDGVDRAEAARRGIRVTHAGDVNAAAVAEFTLGLMIAVSRNLMRGDRLVRAGAWSSLSIARVPLTQGLAGRRLGIYGMGAIGTLVASRAAAFDMAIGYHNRSPRPEAAHRYFESLDALASWCDVLVVALRASADTRHAIDASVLDRLGQDGILINISRGLVVDEVALCAALEAGRIAGAGLDVFEAEPHVPERLRAMDNVVLTPHMAALSNGAQLAQGDLVVDNLRAFFEGRTLQAVVPPP